MTIKQVRFVKADSRNPVQDIAELAVFDASGNPVNPPTSLADGSVTTAKLADNAVTSAKIQDGSITGTDLANNTVTAGKIASGVLPTNATKEKAVWSSRPRTLKTRLAKLRLKPSSSRSVTPWSQPGRWRPPDTLP